MSTTLDNLEMCTNNNQKSMPGALLRNNTSNSSTVLPPVRKVHQTASQLGSHDYKKSLYFVRSSGGTHFLRRQAPERAKRYPQGVI